MRCILCDRCKKIVEDERKIKVVTYARPLNIGGGKHPARSDDRQMNDHIWTMEICPACAEAFEEFMEPQNDTVPDENPGTTPGTDPGTNPGTDPDDPSDDPEDTSGESGEATE